jgi:metallo-beta-lactamase class B
MQKLGLDPKQIKYILISHAHTDHIEGEILQKKYCPRRHGRARLGHRGEISESLQDDGAQARHRMTDGMKIALGGKTVTIC